ncbi:hypothetical protein GGR56DRAFT_157408, partial [Xylariaceae sp. FL0804]
HHRELFRCHSPSRHGRQRSQHGASRRTRPRFPHGSTRPGPGVPHGVLARRGPRQRPQCLQGRGHPSICTRFPGSERVQLRECPQQAAQTSRTLQHSRQLCGAPTAIGHAGYQGDEGHHAGHQGAEGNPARPHGEFLGENLGGLQDACGRVGQCYRYHVPHDRRHLDRDRHLHCLPSQDRQEIGWERTVIGARHQFGGEHGWMSKSGISTQDGQSTLQMS